MASTVALVIERDTPRSFVQIQGYPLFREPPNGVYDVANLDTPEGRHLARLASVSRPTYRPAIPAGIGLKTCAGDGLVSVTIHRKIATLRFEQGRIGEQVRVGFSPEVPAN